MFDTVLGQECGLTTQDLFLCHFLLFSGWHALAECFCYLLGCEWVYVTLDQMLRANNSFMHVEVNLFFIILMLFYNYMLLFFQQGSADAERALAVAKLV